MDRRKFLSAVSFIPMVAYSCDKIEKTIEQRTKQPEIITIKANEDYFINHWGGNIANGNFKGKDGYLDSLNRKQIVITPNPKKNLKIINNRKFPKLESIKITHVYENIYTIESLTLSSSDSTKTLSDSLSTK